MIKILHTGDIHLDSPFSGLDQKRAEERKNELRSTFSSMMKWARENNVDIILIAGDLFDSDFATRETIGLIVREMRRCNAEIFIIAGNHDPISASSVYTKEGIFPDNVHVFRSEELEKISVDRLGVDVYGYSFLTKTLRENPAEGKKVEDLDKINILLAHGDTSSSDSKYCPVDEALIRNFGADYTALGHLHNAAEPKRIGDSVYAYCGCLEGRDFGETGVKGALLVEAEKKDGKADVTVKKLRFSKRRYEKASLYVGGASSKEEITGKIREYITQKEYGEETLLSLTLKGEVPSALVINTKDIESKIDSLYFFRLTDGTHPAESREELEADITVKGQFYRELKALLDSDDESEKRTAQRALKYGLAALSGENIIDF